jgi:hypothetical protein
MELPASDTTNPTELAPLNVIRVETAISRYPVHRLAKQGTVPIQIHEKSLDGKVLIQWDVSYSSRFGQPGPLAYKLDTLLVNRRIEEASRPVAKIIKLGSLHEICRELRISGGKPRDNIKNALYQNASAFITAKIRYKVADGQSSKDLETGFTRYSVIFTGEELPDGRKADAVYIVLNDVFMQVINGAETRPLDYDYLNHLPPASQRLYEILSYCIYGALKYGRRQAKLSYAEFCTYAPLTRFLKWDQVRPQMARIHRPHLKSGYIESVEFEQSAGQDGKPEWVMVYTPGLKAKAEFRAFTKRGGPRILEMEQSPPALSSPVEAEESPLERELISRGITPSTARELISTCSEERITAQVEHFDWLKEKHPKKLRENPSGYLASAIRGDYAPLKGFESKAERIEKANAQARKKREEIAARKEQEQEQVVHTQVKAFWETLSVEEKETLDAEALEAAPTDIASTYAKHKATRRSFAESLFSVSIRQPYIRAKLGLIETEAKKKPILQRSLFD